MSTRETFLSGEFAWRRIHSLLGLWLVGFLCIHLTINSQAALWVGDYGAGFIRLANLLESIPYIQVVEASLLGVPILVHMVWGIRRILQAKTNSGRSDGSTPSFSYGRNRAFTLQRYSSWILAVGLVAHIVQMRFLEYPKERVVNNQVQYLSVVSPDEGLAHVAARLHVQLEPQGPKKVLVVASSPGTAMLFMVRDTFKSPWMIGFYTLFLLATVFHAGNGLWTALITWGVLLSYRSQRAFLPVVWLFIGVLGFLGLAAIWGSYWINLRS